MLDKDMACYDEFVRKCEDLGVYVHEMRGPNRETKTVVQRRKIAKWLSSLGFYYSQIGRVMNKHHSSVMLMVDGEKRKRKNKMGLEWHKKQK